MNLSFPRKSTRFKSSY